METCVRGFSYMPGNISIRLVENQELERTWRSRRRQLLKEQEEKIYKEFIKDTDVLEVVSKDDPYQFLQQLPEACIQELLETELQKTKKELQLEKESPDEAEPPKEENQHPSHVTFAEDTDREDGEMFRVYDTDDNDNEKDPSGISEDNYDGFCESTSNSPVTVRERDTQNNSPTLYEKKHEKPTESVSAVIESSIYCAKVKELRMKIQDEIDAIIASLDRHDVMRIEQEQVTRKCRRSAEFSSRFNRIYMYQLKRQMEDLKRNSQNPLPFAKHTHFQAQMVRIASLHHNLLQAFQVFHKSIEQTSCLQDSATVLHALALTARSATAHCVTVPAPRDMKQAAAALYNDDMVEACDNLDEVLCNHSLRISEALSNAGVDSQVQRKGKPKKKIHSPKSGPSKSNTDTRLSMYSMDTLRMNPSAKTSSKLNCSGFTGITKLHGLAGVGNKKTSPKAKSPKRTPRSSRRPLMRAGKNPPRLRAHLPKDTEISTMVEAVEMQSSYMSRSASPPPSAWDTPRSHRLSTFTSPRKGRNLTSSAWNHLSPKQRLRHSPQQLIKALSLIQGKDDRMMTPVSKIHCSEREPPPLATKLDRFKKNDKIKITNYRDNKNKARPNSGSYITGVETTRTGKDTHTPKNHEIDSKSFVKEVNDQSAKETVHGRTDILKSTKETVHGRTDMLKSTKESVHSRTEMLTSTKENVNGPIDMFKEYDPNKPMSSSASTSGLKDAMDGTESFRSESRSDERRVSRMGPASEVTRLLKQLCSGDSSGENISGPKNAQLHFVNGSSPRPPPSTPQLLKILETTIKKKLPKPWFGAAAGARDPARHRMQFNLSDRTSDSHFQYRTKFVQHMLESSLYANSAVGKPWEVICSVSDKITDELLLQCASEMQIKDVIVNLYLSETK